MNYEQAEQLLKEHISNTDNFEIFKGFDIFEDRSWSGHYSDDFLIDIEKDEYIYFDGHILFSTDEEGHIDSITIEGINDFEHFSCTGETLNKFN